ncbi:MAG: hypothetical protein ICV73_05910 [Acetobacteraceae bacterium]|nr:hypothetical protein [Acetobacteraceae bacterium]
MTEARGHRAGWFVYLALHINEILLASLCVVCSGLWMSSANILVPSSWREQGRVLSCVYFNGFQAREHRYGYTPRRRHLACPMPKLG